MAKSMVLAFHALGKKFEIKGSKLKISGLCITRFTDEKGRIMDTNRISLRLGNDRENVKLSFALAKGIKLIKNICINRYAIEVDAGILPMLDIQNKFYVFCDGAENRIAYSLFDRKTGKNKATGVIEKDGLACYVRQSRYNAMYLSVREPQYYDTPQGRRKIFLAKLCAFFSGKGNIIYLYEKECSRYEESASVLYEKMIDAGYNNAYYIINEDNPAIERLPQKYRRNLVYKDSFKHLVYFFASKTFISTETMSHALKLRTANRTIVNKNESKKIANVFLQHGVMYMVSLDSASRVSFRQHGLKLYRVVASSELEAQHFIELGGFKREELYVTGLAKFDRCLRHEEADRIVIMPTWRRWESNLAGRSFPETGYYKMIEKIFDAIPRELQEKVVILPHPLMQKFMEKGENRLSPYMATKTHDEVLKDCDLLITDYSSISYDAFYRGSNVLFYWAEKEYCMEQYGEGTRLMLTEELAFGDVCYRPEEITDSIMNSYGRTQRKEYVDRFRKIVEFHDGKNAERIIENLKRDGVL